MHVCLALTPLLRFCRRVERCGLPAMHRLNTNRAVAQIHYTNRFARTPNVRYIFSHAGRSIPYLAARFAIVNEMGFIAGGEQRGTAADMFRRIYLEHGARRDRSCAPHAARRGGNQSRSLWNRFSVPAPRPGYKLQTAYLAEFSVG
jgi:hypothetical protein